MYIGTDGLKSHLSTLTHKAVRCTLEDGTKGILHRMPDGILFEKDNGNWTTERDIKVDGGCTFGVVYEELKKDPDYNLATNNCVQTADRVAQKISKEERERAFKQTASSVVTAGAGSVLQDVLNEREVDGNAAMLQSIGAGAGSVTGHAVHGVTGSSPIAGTTGAMMSTYVAGKFRGASDKQAVEATCQAGTTVAVQEFSRFTVHNFTRCARTAGLVALMVTDLPDIADDAMKGRYLQTVCRIWLSGFQASYSVALCSCGPVGWVASTCFDHYSSKFRDAIGRSK